MIRKSSHSLKTLASKARLRMYSTVERGTAATADYRMYFKNTEGKIISPFHDIPLVASHEGGTLYNMIVEIPRWTNAKMEIATKEPFNPIKQDVKKGKLRYVHNCFPYHGYIWNYGALPQTWENPNYEDPNTKSKGDNDPIDVCEIGSQTLKRGQVVPVKVLGVMALIDDGETDWKLIVIKADDPLAKQLHDINDVETRLPGLLEATHRWFKIYKIPDNKPPNVFAFDGKAKGVEFAKNIIKETHEQWKDLMYKTEKGKSEIMLTNSSLTESKSKVPADEAESVLKSQAEFREAHQEMEECSSVCYINAENKQCYSDGFASVEGLTDKDCIGNRQEAVEVGRLCSRRCKKDVPCENTRKHCLCDGLCGFSCIKPDLNCPDLPVVENGNFFPKSTIFNTKVVYQCNPGHYLFGSRERLCQGDEEWSGTPAECMTEPLCHNPLKINHARNPSDGIYRLNDKVNYSCYPGYQTKGSSEASCRLIERNQTAWVWSGAPFKCIPKSCGDPGQIENGKRHGESFIVASSVLYSCNDGFEMIGQARRYCQSDNQWSGQPPHCEPVTCNPTDHLENGKINYGYPLIFNSTVEYSCDYGFRLVGPQNRTCGPERKLVGEVPICEEIDCGQLGPLHNGYIKGYSNRMGDRKEFICMDGMKFIGEHKDSKCLESGFWSHPLPKCLAPCKVPSVEHASKIYIVDPNSGNQSNSSNITLKTTEPGAEVVHGSFLEILCEKNYELDEHMNGSSIMQAPMCNNETWTYLPKCKPASCWSLPPGPKNGRVRVYSIEHGSKGYVHCLDGYRLRGDNTTLCIKGTWSPIETSCTEIYCGFPGIIEHGRVLLVGLTGMYDYKPYIRRISINRQIAYECEVGYRLSDGAPSGATCMDGQWKPDGLPTCIKE